MKTCSVKDFMEELKPWLDSDHIRSVVIDEADHMVVHFLDGMKNVYEISDCDREQIVRILSDLEKKGIKIG